MEPPNKSSDTIPYEFEPYEDDDKIQHVIPNIEDANNINGQSINQQLVCDKSSMQNYICKMELVCPALMSSNVPLDPIVK